MIFNRLRTVNVGNFSGKHEFILRPNSGSKDAKTIILFGGMNGAGKTTIFDAIKLCLYGPGIFPQISASKYQDYLKSKIHNSNNSNPLPTSASIELEFEYSRLGAVHTYQVERHWNVNGRQVEELLSIKKNGHDIDDIERDKWQDFIKEMVPPGLSQLFFFDGEKIQKMMFDDSNSELKSSIMSLLGLDLIERLQADLKIYKAKLIKGKTKDDYANEIERYEKECKILEAECKKINDEKARLINAIKRSTNRISDYKNKMSAQGEGYFRNRAKMEERKNTLEKDIELLRDTIREFAAGLLPVAIAFPYALKLKDQIKKENSFRINSMVSKVLKDKCDDMLNVVDDENFLISLNSTKKLLKEAKREIKLQIKKLFAASNGDENVKELFGFSQKQTIEILQTLDKALKELPKELQGITQKYEIKFTELQGIVSNLSKVPENDLIRPMYERLEELNSEYSELNTEKENYDTQLNDIASKKSELQRNIDLLYRKLEANKKTNEKLTTVTKVEKVLLRYYEDLAKLKIVHLEKKFLKIFKSLHSKEDLIFGIKIDPITFDVCLFGSNGTKIKKNSLSSGELELYAISMLWALAKTSGQKLPFIIDTPLARLDSHHRDKIVQLFFPHASHQTMIFSTNTEIDKQYFDDLRPFIAKAYNLEYIDQQKSTVAKEGYFWN